MIYDRFDVVLLLFPFTEKRGQKQRPGIVLSGKGFNTTHRQVIAAMVTTASNTHWPSDLPISAYSQAGLRQPCVIRMKIFSVADELILKRVGALADDDRVSVLSSLENVLMK